MDYSDAVARQHAATPKDMATIQETYRFTVFYFATVFGPKFDAKHYPRTAAFFIKVTNTANGVVGRLKEHYKRLRPFQAHPDKIKLLVRNEPGYGYPSGHTTRSRLDAFIVAELAPSSRVPIFKAAELVATDRILAGEHYVTDLEAGRTLGKMLFGLLSKNPEFQRELKALKDSPEWNPPPSPVISTTPAGH